MASASQAKLQISVAAANFANGARDEFAIAHGGFGGNECSGVHGIGDCTLRIVAANSAMSENATEAQAGESGGFGKCARDD